MRLRQRAGTAGADKIADRLIETHARHPALTMLMIACSMLMRMDERQRLLDDLARSLTLRKLTTDEQAPDAIDERIRDIESRLAGLDARRRAIIRAGVSGRGAAGSARRRAGRRVRPGGNSGIKPESRPPALCGLVEILLDLRGQPSKGRTNIIADYGRMRASRAVPEHRHVCFNVLSAQNVAQIAGPVVRADRE
jgi:hypothetical protein